MPNSLAPRIVVRFENVEVYYLNSDGQSCPDPDETHAELFESGETVDDAFENLVRGIVARAAAAATNSSRDICGAEVSYDDWRAA